MTLFSSFVLFCCEQFYMVFIKMAVTICEQVLHTLPLLGPHDLGILQKKKKKINKKLNI